jgi:hypothetical protein
MTEAEFLAWLRELGPEYDFISVDEMREKNPRLYERLVPAVWIPASPSPDRLSAMARARGLDLSVQFEAGPDARFARRYAPEFDLGTVEFTIVSERGEIVYGPFGCGGMAAAEQWLDA